METPRSTDRLGLSLIEVLVILAVLSVLVGLAIPRLDSAAFRADANVRLVRSTLTEAQHRATNLKHNVLVSFSVVSGRIRIVEDRDNNSNISPGEKISWKGLTDGATLFSPPTGITGLQTPAPVNGSALMMLDSMPTVIMLKDGTASTGMDLYLKIQGDKGDAVRSVSVIQATGRTQWHRMTRDGWKRGG